MKKLVLLLFMGICLTAFTQIDRDQLALDIAKADAANLEQLKSYIWKQESVVIVDGAEKLTTLNEFSIDEDGKVNVHNVDSHTDVKQQRGIRGRIQANTAESNIDYVENALKLALKYAFISKGQLIDFFGKAEITEKDGIIEATAKDIYMKGDKLTLKVESDTKLFVEKEFSSMMGEDPVNGNIMYDKFTSGISHTKSSVLNLPAKQAVINSKNIDYLEKVR